MIRMKNNRIIFSTLLLFSILIIGLSGIFFISGFKLTTFNLNNFKNNLLKNNSILHSLFYQTISDYDMEIPSIVDELQLPLFHLILSRNDIAHFYDLYEKYDKMDDYGEKYYQSNNKWRKSKLLYNGNEYDIKIKSHGLSPTSHRAGNYISYNIRLPRYNNIWKARKSSLIIRDRLRDKRLLVYDIAERFNIIYRPINPIRLKINNWKEKMYYYQYRLDNDYLESIGKSSYKLFGYSVSSEIDNKSSVYTEGDFNYEDFYKYFIEVFNEIKYPENNRKPIFDRYFNFNNDIFENKYQDIQQYFDIDYISAYNAARTITGFTGHGASKSNFYVLLNTANGKFYPAFTQDNIPSYLELKDNGTVEKQINYFYNNDVHRSQRRPLYCVMDENDFLRQEKYKKIYQFITENGETTRKEHEKIIYNDHRLHYFGWFRLLLNNLGQSIDVIPTGHNIDLLKNYLEESNPELSISTSDNKLVIEISPQSMSAIRFDKLILKENISFKPKSLENINFKLITSIEDSIVDIIENNNDVLLDDNGIDLYGFVKDYEFSTALGEESQKINRKYFLIFSFNNNISDKNKLALSFINTITEKQINSDNIIINRKDSHQMNLISMNANPKVDDFEVWKGNHQHLKFTRTKKNELILHAGTYQILHDIHIPKDLKLIINPGTILQLGKNVVLVTHRGININGTINNPVIITSINPDQPFGSIGILGDDTSQSKINHLYLSNGNEKWVDGTYFSGGLSIHYNNNVVISNSTFTNCKADDGLNIKYSNNVWIENCTFKENAIDHVDLDYCKGAVVDSRFITVEYSNINGDGLDLSGSQMYVKDNQFIGIGDKGLSVGEESDILIINNTFKNNKTGVAVKDLSNAFLLENIFEDDSVDVDVFQKKDNYDGASVYIFSNSPKDYSLKYTLDEYSNINYLSSDIAPVIEIHKDKLDVQLIFNELKVKTANIQ